MFSFELGDPVAPDLRPRHAAERRHLEADENRLPDDAPQPGLHVVDQIFEAAAPVSDVRGADLDRQRIVEPRRGEVLDGRLAYHRLHRRAGPALEQDAQVAQVLDAAQLQQGEPGGVAHHALRVNLVVADAVPVAEPEQLVQCGRRLAHAATSARKLRPRGALTPKYSATVAPRSANDSRTPSALPCARRGE